MRKALLIIVLITITLSVGACSLKQGGARPTTTATPTTTARPTTTAAPTTAASLKTPEQIAVLMEPVSVIIVCYDYNGDLYSAGSGFFINNKGYIVTNYHVIDGQEKSTVYAILNNGEEYAIDKVVNYDIGRDLFVCSINYSNANYAKLGDSSSIATGNTIFTYGSPLGISNTLTQGVISNKNVVLDNDLKYIQISASISPGSSGGTLINQKGEVIGITTLTLTYGQNMNMAIPINDLKSLISKGPLNIAFDNFDRGLVIKKIVYSNGTYTGTLKNGLHHGHGTYEWTNGDVYEGDWVNGQMTGYGTYTGANGNVCVGNWVNGVREGTGTMTWATGDKYEGDWLNDQRTGYGTLTWATGDKYEGDWLNDQRTGYGTYTWATGDKYEGDWLNDQRTGYGTLTWVNGDKYEGDWLNGVQEGTGTYTWANGTSWSGEWINGEQAP